MTVVRDSTPDAFLQHAGPLLYEREAEYGLALGLVEGLISDLNPEIPPLLLRVIDNGRTAAVCVQTRFDNVVVSHLNDLQAAALAQFFRTHALPLPGAIGPLPGVRTLCASYSNAPVEVRMNNRILKLTQVTPPSLAPGQLRIAAPTDFETAKHFFREFHVECLPKELPDEDRIASVIEGRIARLTVFFWEKDGALVSCAHSTRPTRNGIAIGAVYTPPAERGKGYASNLVAALSQYLLDQGKSFCVLFTDTRNATSNKIYESMGYRVIGTSEYLSFV